jgi:hypothetical protein
MYSDGCVDTGAANLSGPMVSSFKQEETMQYLKDLIERFGKALRIKSPNKTRESVPTNHLGPVHGPVRDPR